LLKIQRKNSEEAKPPTVVETFVELWVRSAKNGVFGCVIFYITICGCKLRGDRRSGVVRTDPFAGDRGTASSFYLGPGGIHPPRSLSTPLQFQRYLDQTVAAPPIVMAQVSAAYLLPPFGFGRERQFD
jgi:hypothetical protein